MLTLFYASATLLQSWRIKCACNKLAEQIAQQSSVAFYVLPDTCNNGFDPCLATSELCTNRNLAKVTEVLWLQGRQRGCCLRPMQLLHISPWISFNVAPSLLPFAYEETPENILKSWSIDHNKCLRLVLETEVNRDKEASEDFLKIENYGKLIAWRIDSHLAVLIETNIEYFTKLLIRTYLQNNLHINDNLRLLRIQSIKDEGEPQPLQLVVSHSRKPTRNSIELTNEEWQKHLEGLRSLCVLASQATEFAYKQNLTEGKTGVVKPDLIPSDKKIKQEEQNAAKVNLEVKKNLEKSDKIISSPQATIVDGTRFTTTKVLESPVKAATAKEPSSSKVSSPNKSGSLENSRTVKNIVVTNTTPTLTTSPKTIVSKSTTNTSKKLSNTLEPKVETNPPSIQNTSTINPTPKSTENMSAVNNDAKRPVLENSKRRLIQAKPLNILVYSDSANVRESVINTLKDILEDNTYTIYQLSEQQAELKTWLDSTALLIVCGSVSSTSISQILVDYFLLGGKVLSICSDILNFILPNYRTAEIREHELVQFSYDKWQKVKMMHHIFCYQPSPVKKNFSTDSEDSTHLKKQSGMLCPRSIELKDLRGDIHNLDVQILATEETWQTPSILLAKSAKSGGRALFSQIHLETNPIEFEDDEMKYLTLKQNDKIRLEILCDLLSKYLDMHTKNSTNVANRGIVYKNAYFLGHHESKFQLLNKLKEDSGSNIIHTPGLAMQFCGAEDKPIKAESNVLPILIHSCPDDFSTVDYFDNLKTNYIGRLVIYAPIISSTMDIVEHLELTNGIAVIARQQTNGVGRSGNQWLSPLGCAMCSLQLHIKQDSIIGQHIPMIQHLIGLAIVNAFHNHEDYQVLNLGIKWPNDIYYNGNIKIGGLLLKTSIFGNLVIINVGFALNLDNSKPTCCINDVIHELNKSRQKQIPKLNYEKLLAITFNEIEQLIEKVQIDGIKDFFKLYTQRWLHTDQEVKILSADGKEETANIVGVDDNGFLRVKMKSGKWETVQPDGNSFDMLKGLIVPKYN